MLFLQNTKLCTQILCLMLILMLFCFGILIGIININFYYFGHIIVDSSKTILDKQFKTEIKTQSYFSKLLIERYQQREKSRLESINKIFQFTWDNKIDLNEAENCLNTNISKYSGVCSMCYGIINNNVDLKSTKFKEYLQIVNLFSFTWLMRDNKFEILFAGTTEEKFIAVWPRFGIISFDPQSRPWYTIQANQPFNSTLYQTQFTNPYQHVVYKCTTVSHTQSLYDNNFQMIGVVAVQLNFSTTFPNYLQSSNSITGYILNEEYIILQMKGENQTINSFFDQNVTGFDQSIKTILFNYVNQNQILQYCANQNKELLCLNNVQGQELIIEAKLLGDKKQILILVFDPTNDLQIQEFRQKDLQIQIKNLIEKIFIELIILNFSTILFTLLINYKITNKISDITLKAHMLIFQYHNSIFKILQLNTVKIKQKGVLNCLDQLELAFANLNNRTLYNKKQNPYCKILTNLCTFPSKECLDFARLKQSMNQLQNENYCLPKYIIKQMVNETQYLLKMYISPYSK